MGGFTGAGGSLRTFADNRVFNPFHAQAQAGETVPKKPAAIEWPCELSLALRNALVEAAKVRSFDVGEHFLMGKGTENGLCYLVRGLMEVRIHQSQKSSPFAIFKGGGWFGGTTFDEEPDFLYQISAIESAELLFVPDGFLRDLAERNTEIFKLLYRVTAHHANSAIDLLFASSSMPAPQKLAYFIWRLSLSFSKIPGAAPMIPMP